MVLLRSFIPPRATGGVRASLSLFNKSAFDGVGNLDPNLTINGITETPVFRYKGGDATATNWPAWTYGETLTKVGGTAPTLNTGSPLMGDNDDSVQFNNGGSYRADNNSFADITTEDFVIEMVVDSSSVSGDAFMDKRGATGYLVDMSPAPTARLFLNDGVDDAFIRTAAMPVQTWHHVIIFVDKSGFMVAYTNGAQGSAGACSSIDSLTVAAPFAIGAYSGGTASLAGKIAYVAMWKRSGWLDTHLQKDVAEERFHRLIGIYPTRAKGTACPTTWTRATSAAIDKMEDSDTTRKIYHVGAGWLRTASRVDVNSEKISGYLAEIASTNLCLESQTISTDGSAAVSPWVEETPADAFDVNGATAPDKTDTADGLIAASGAAEHGINQDITLTAAVYCMSAFVKKGDNDWFQMHNTTIANGAVWFNISTGATGTAQAGIIEKGIEDWGDGWYRCWATFLGTAAAHTIEFHSEEADNDDMFSGDGSTVNMYIWGCQVEQNWYPSSYIPTTTGTVTRNKDELTYKGDDGNLGGVGSNQRNTIACDIYRESHTNGQVGQGTAALSDGAAGGKRILLTTTASGNRIRLFVANGGTQADIQSVTEDITDGDIHNIRATFVTDNFHLYSDGSEQGTADTSGTPPDGLDQIDIGMDQSNTNQLGGLVSNFRVFEKITLKG